MALPVTSLYAGLAGLWLIYLVFAVVFGRRRHMVAVGDGGHDDLTLAIRGHANATETVPIALILLGLAEGMGTPALLLHGLGLTLIGGRVLHAGYFLRADRPSKCRFYGMILTIAVIGLLSVGLIAHGLWDLLA